MTDEEISSYAREIVAVWPPLPAEACHMIASTLRRGLSESPPKAPA